MIQPQVSISDSNLLPPPPSFILKINTKESEPNLNFTFKTRPDAAVCRVCGSKRALNSSDWPISAEMSQPQLLLPPKCHVCVSCV